MTVSLADSLICAAPAPAVYRLVAAAHRDGARHLPEALGVDIERVQPTSAVRSLWTSWRVFELSAGTCVLRVEHVAELTEEGAAGGTFADTEAGVRTALRRAASDELASYRRACANARPTGTDRSEVRPSDRYHLRHVVVCPAAPAALYRLVRDTSAWPDLFAACVGAEVVEAHGTTEIVRVSANQDGRTVSWDSRRRYYDEILRADYELVVPMPFVAEMWGEWRAVPLDDGSSLLAVDRWWTMLDDISGIRDDVPTAAAAAEFVRAYVDRNAAAEMRAIAGRVAVAVADAGAPS